MSSFGVPSANLQYDWADGIRRRQLVIRFGTLRIFV